MLKQCCHKYYLGMLNDDMTMIDHLVLYIDTILPNGRKVVVPCVDKTFESEDSLRAFFNAKVFVQDFFGHKDDSRTFIMPAPEDETEIVKHNIPYQILREFGEKIEKNQKKCDPDIAKVINDNFWSLLGEDDDTGNQTIH
jgi:hypothetical protein